MSKLVVLKLSEGSVEHGYLVSLQIGEESRDHGGHRLVYHPFAEVSGRLPPNPDIFSLYTQWQSAYRRLGLRSRLHAPKVQVTNVSFLQDCEQAAQAIGHALNDWLRAESFRPIREKWLEQLLPDESIRVVLQTDDPKLQQLPWQVWELIERYSNVELALSLPVYERVAQPIAVKPTVRILAILGNSQGIDVQSDCALLEQLPDTEVCFLVEPQRQALNDSLWAQSWDILFFAGHSSSDAERSTGELQINQTDSLTIPQLKYALRKALKRGLKLAVFNSCDGLGLARNLADLHIPQMIVMREPVPDRVAQAFLQHFLAVFAQGQPLYSSVREAREKLQGLEDQFPCATWLPVICQNLAEAPIAWQDFTGETDPSLPSPPQSAEPNPKGRSRTQARYKPGLPKALVAGVLCAVGVVTLRSLGVLQASELYAFDQWMRLRPAEPYDDRLLIVTIDDAERETYGEELPDLGWISMSDRYLNLSLEQLQQHQPRLIGLDLYRDFPVDPSQARLSTQLQQPNLVTVCKARFAGGDSIAPPPDSPPEQVGFSDFVVDDDNVLRRHLLAMTPELVDPGIPCTSPNAFSTQLASRYLAAQGIELNTAENTVLDFLSPQSGGYWRADAQGSQILLNYRLNQRPASQVSLTDVLSGQVNPEIIRDRIVLIGVTAASAGDTWLTPLDPAMPGVVVQAHMVSQILSAVLDDRSLIRVWSEGEEIVWILGWAIAGSVLGWYVRSWVSLSLAISASSLLLAGLCWGLFVQGRWVPLTPPLMALVLTSGTVAVYLNLSGASIPPSNPS